MSGAVIGFGLPSARGAPPASALGDLYNQLAGANLGGAYFIVNGFGEAWGYSQAGSLFSPSALAAWVQQPGHVWVDWCGWPGYYQAEPGGGQVLTLGPAGFQTFAKALGYPWLDQVTFAVPVGFYQPLGVFPFARGFPTQQNMAGTAVQHGTFSGGQPLTANGYAALVALTPPQGGVYVYATYVAGFGGVPAATIAGFVANVLAGRGAGAGIVRVPYPAPPTNPGNPGTPGSPAPASGPRWGEIAAVGAGAVVLGLLGWAFTPSAPPWLRRLTGREA